MEKGTPLKSESALIACLIMEPGHVELVKGYVKNKDYFQTPFWGQCYEVILRLHDEGRAIDLTTVHDMLADVSKTVYLATAINKMPTAAHVEEYARQVRDNYARVLARQIMAGFNPLDLRKYRTVQDVYNQLELCLEKVTAVLSQSKETTMEELVSKSLAMLESGENRLIIPTGYYDIDKVINGLEPPEMIIVAARPSLGKTSLALNIALNVAAEGHGVLFVSLETSKDKIMDRVLTIDSQVPSERIKHDKMEEGDYSAIVKASARLAGLPMTIVDNITDIIDIRAAVAKQAAKQSVVLVVVDYLQLITSDLRFRSRHEEVGYYARQLSQIAKRYNMSIMTLSQLSRKVEERKNKRPLLSDLYESGMIEASLDKALLLYRDEYYNKDTKDKGICEIGIPKHRDGETGFAKLVFEGKVFTFRNMFWKGEADE